MVIYYTALSLFVISMYPDFVELISELDVTLTVYSFTEAKQICSQNRKSFGGKIAWHKLNKTNETSGIWLNGYVKRSLVIEYYGCFEISSSEQDIGTRVPELSGLMGCSFHCKSELKGDDFILLRNHSCFCLKNGNWKILRKSEISSSQCSISCDENELDQCGGNGKRYSVYQLSKQQRLEKDVGSNCFIWKPNAKNIVRERCDEATKFECQHVSTNVQAGSTVINTTCQSQYLSHTEAQRHCHRYGQYISTVSEKECDIGEKTSDDIWASAFAREEILWDSEDRPESILHECLLAVFGKAEQKYKLRSEPCHNKHRAACLWTPLTDTTSNERALYSSSELDVSTQTETQVLNNEDSSNVSLGSIVGIVLGIVFGVALALIIFCRLKRGKKPKNTRLLTGSLYYSTAQPCDNSERTIIAQPQYDYSDHVLNSSSGNMASRQPVVDQQNYDYTEHILISADVNNKDDVYNHLGDSELQQPQHNATIYDHSGLTGNDQYDCTFTTIKHKDCSQHDLYDCNQCSDTYSQANSKTDQLDYIDAYDHT